MNILELVQREVAKRGLVATCDLVKTRKQNSVILEGIQFTAPGSEFVPVAHLPKDYALMSDIQLKDMAEQIVDAYENSLCCSAKQIDLKDLFNAEYVLEHVFPCLVKTSENRELVEQCGPITRELEDLTVILRVVADQTGKGISSAVVHANYAKAAGLDADELFAAAYLNLMKSYVDISSMEDILSELTGLPAEGFEMPFRMYCLSTIEVPSGSSALLRTDKLADVCLRHKATKLIILPSSTHEILVVPVADGIDIDDDFNDMIQSVNATFVDADEVLSDHAYIFDLMTRQIKSL